MKLKKYLSCNLFVLSFLLLQTVSSYGQQLPLLNQNRENLNPAYISTAYFKYNLPTNATIRYRQQWTAIKGAPQTMVGTFTHYAEETHFSFGGDIINDVTGPTGFTGLYGRGSYALELSRDLLLSIGIRGGIVQYRVKGDDLHFLEPGDVANNNVSKLYPDLSMGAMFYYKDHYYVGFSVPQLFGLNLTFKDDVDEYEIQRVRHYYGTIGGRFDLGDGSWVEASSESRYVQHIPFYINGRVQFDYRDLFWVATSASSSKEFSGEIGVMKAVGMNSNMLRFGYTFSNFFQSYGAQFGSVHELGVSFSW